MPKGKTAATRKNARGVKILQREEGDLKKGRNDVKGQIINSSSQAKNVRFCAIAIRPERLSPDIRLNVFFTAHKNTDLKTEFYFFKLRHISVNRLLANC